VGERIIWKPVIAPGARDNREFEQAGMFMSLAESDGKAKPGRFNQGAVLKKAK